MPRSAEEIVAALLITFAAEAVQHLQAMNRHLLDLEAGTEAPDSRAELFRAAHSLKGAARAVNLADVERSAHELEDVFAGLCRDETRPDQDILDYAYVALDRLAALVAAAAPAEPAAQGAEAAGVRVGSRGDGTGSAGPAAYEPEPVPYEAAPDAYGQQEHRAYEPGSGPEPAVAAYGGERARGEGRAAAGPRGEPAAAYEPEPARGEGRAAAGPRGEPAAYGDEPARGEGRAAGARVETVRVATTKLDAVLAGVGELVVGRIGMEQRLAEADALAAVLTGWDTAWSMAWARHRRGDPRQVSDRGALLAEGRAQLGHARQLVGQLRRRLDADVRRIGQVTADLHDDVRRTRMVPAAAVFEVLPRMVRDLAHEAGKQVRLLLEGADTEVDRALLEQVKDPLTHLLRNSVDHGIEAPAARAAAGKPEVGTIRLRAGQRAEMLVIEVADDGAGIHPDRVRAAAVGAGLLAAEAAAHIPDAEVMPLIFQPGFSTRTAVTALSGRGVGLDVVRAAVTRLHGAVDVRSEPGRGTTFVLSLPLSVSTMHCVLVEVAGQTFAVPTATVDRIVRVTPDGVGRAGGRAVLRVADRPVTLARLADVLGLPGEVTGTGPAAVLGGQGAQGGQVALLVDGLTGTRELVIKTLPPPLAPARYVAGAAILGSGEVAVLLSAADLVAAAGRVDVPAPAQAPAPARAATVLVVEDSVTIRTLEKDVLESAGFRVEVAGDGLAGWEMLAAGEWDLVVSDIDMPRLDGIELTRRIRASPRLRHLPVVLVTSHESREHRERGALAGADAYLVKGALDQDRLIDTIRRLL
jgi:two-component system chemotaxis sensor kinase CheA